MHSLVAVNGVGDTACQATPRCQALDEMIDIGPRAGEDLLRERARKALVRRAPSFRSSQRAWSVVLAFSKKSPSTPEAAGCSAPAPNREQLSGITQSLGNSAQSVLFPPSFGPHVDWKVIYARLRHACGRGGALRKNG